MPDEFPYDVFLSHSATDKAVVRALAERLRTDGLQVWFDEWEIKVGDSHPGEDRGRAGELPRAGLSRRSVCAKADALRVGECVRIGLDAAKLLSRFARSPQPGRAKDNGPAIYCWVSSARRERVPSGTKEHAQIVDGLLSPLRGPPGLGWICFPLTQR
jgi:hypothetical protein